MGERKNAVSRRSQGGSESYGRKRETENCKKREKRAIGGRKNVIKLLKYN